MISHGIGPVLLISSLALAVGGFPLAAQDTEGAKVVSVVRLSPTEEMGTIEGLPGHQARGPVLTQAPLPPERDLEETEEKQPRVPVHDDRLDIPPEQQVATQGVALSEAQVPGTFLVLRDSSLAPSGLTSNVAEPNVGSQANGIFTTHNWYAETSTNNGSSYSFISPFSTFPNSPSAFGAGFCCDQRVAQDSSRDLIFWYLQYIKTGNTSTSTNGVRVAVTHGQSGLATNSWTYYNFTPALFGLPAGTWLDFPHLQASANYLYFTTNIFNAVTDSFYGAMIVRMPLSQLDSGSSLTLNYLTVVGSYGSIMAVPGAEAAGTRPGRTAMYFGALFSSTSIKVLTWPESSTTLTISTVSGLATTSFSAYACPGPDGLDPCTRGDGRMQTGWITDTELGLMWGSSQNGSSRPYPYTRVVILNPSSLAVLSQPDIYSLVAAWLYPAMSVNERGHLGGTADFLGGTQFPTIAGIIRDDFSPDPSISGWEAYVIAGSNSGTFGRYGDYNGVTAHEKYPKTWLAAGHVQVGGNGNGNAVVHNYWFARERDNPSVSGLDFYTITPCRLMDTRSGSPASSGIRYWQQVTGFCGIPASAAAVAANVTVVSATGSGFVTIWPGDLAQPGTSTINFGLGQVRANNALVTLATDGLGDISYAAFVSGIGSVHLVLDVSGYFAP